MSEASQHLLTPRRERATLLVLGAVQFTHILDYMIIMPLGAQLMRGFNISPVQFTWIVATYSLAAALSGFAGGFILDRFDRKRSLLVLYTGFGVATLADGCGAGAALATGARSAFGRGLSVATTGWGLAPAG